MGPEERQVQHHVFISDKCTISPQVQKGKFLVSHLAFKAVLTSLGRLPSELEGKLIDVLSIC